MGIVSLWLQQEKNRGFLTSVVSGVLSALLNTFGQTELGMSTETSTLLFYYVFGLILAYTLDILFAKRSFLVQGKMIPISYKDLTQRAWLLLRSFAGRSFLRFAMTVVLDTVLGMIFLDIITDFLDSRDILVDWKYRNSAVSVGIAMVTFLLFINRSRFEFAYAENVSPTLEATYLMWTTVMVVLYVIYRQIRGGEKKETKTVPNTLGAMY